MEEEQPYISDFIRAIMRTTDERKLLDAQRDLDGFLDVIDRIEQRLSGDVPPADFP